MPNRVRLRNTTTIILDSLDVKPGGPLNNAGMYPAHRPALSRKTDNFKAGVVDGPPLLYVNGKQTSKQSAYARRLTLTSCAAMIRPASRDRRASLRSKSAHVYSERRCVVSNCWGLRPAVDRDRTSRDIGRPSWSHEDEKGRRAGPCKEEEVVPGRLARRPWRLHIGRT